MEKQLVIFREESLKLFEKISKKDKEIAILNIKLKELATTAKDQENKIYRLTKKNIEG